MVPGVTSRGEIVEVLFRAASAMNVGHPLDSLSSSARGPARTRHNLREASRRPPPRRRQPAPPRRKTPIASLGAVFHARRRPSTNTSKLISIDVQSTRPAQALNRECRDPSFLVSLHAARSSSRASSVACVPLQAAQPLTKWPTSSRAPPRRRARHAKYDRRPRSKLEQRATSSRKHPPRRRQKIRGIWTTTSTATAV